MSSEGPGSGQGEREPLEVLTYNVHGIWVPYPNNFFATRKSRYRKLRDRFEKYDLVMLQEFFGTNSGKRDRFQQYLLEDYDHQSHHVVARGPVGFFYESGLALLSTLQPARRDLEHYSACHGRLFDVWNGSDCLSVKGFLHARVRTELGREIDVYTTHLDAAGSRKNRETRVPQMDELEAYIRSHSIEEGVPVILAGDFNTELGPARGAAISGETKDVLRLRKLIHSLGLSDACASGACDPNDCGRWKMCDKERIDYVFYRDGADTKLVHRTSEWEPFFVKQGSRRRLSDHPGLAVSFWVTGARE